MSLEIGSVKRFADGLATSILLVISRGARCPLVVTSGGSMSGIGYEGPYRVRSTLVEAHRLAWRRIAEPGAWLDGARRVAVAAEVRAAQALRTVPRTQGGAVALRGGRRPRGDRSPQRGRGRAHPPSDHRSGPPQPGMGRRGPCRRGGRGGLCRDRQHRLYRDGDRHVPPVSRPAALRPPRTGCGRAVGLPRAGRQAP